MTTHSPTAKYLCDHNKIRLQQLNREGAIRAMDKITAMAAVAVAVIALVLLPAGGRGEEMRPTTAAAHPHGLPFESPLALSPAAYDFFHPTARARRGSHGVARAPAQAPRGPQQQLRESAVSGAGVAKADKEEGSAVAAPVEEAHRRHAVVVAGVVVGAAAAALVAVGVAFAVVRRRVVAARGGAGAVAGVPKSNA